MVTPFNIDRLANGFPGASARLTEGFAEVGLDYTSLRQFDETWPCEIEGSEEIARACAPHFLDKRVWTEGFLDIRNAVLRGRFKAPVLPEPGLLLHGSPILQSVQAVGDDVPEGQTVRMEAAIQVGGRGGFVYGHWLVDFLPQLMIAQEIRALGHEAPILLVNCPPFGRQLVDILGLADHCHFAAASEVIEVDRLFLPLTAKRHQVYAAQPIARSFAAFAEACAPLPPPPVASRRLVVMRRKQPMAGNAALLAEALVGRGFAAVHPEEFTLPQQVALFREAEVVVGEDGSALHNIGFCQPGGQLVVLARGSKVNAIHSPVAHGAGVSLTYFESETAPDGSYRLDIDAVLALPFI